MPIVLTGSDLTIDDVVAVARANATATLAPEATARMAATRAIVDRILERGDEVYGLNTGVGVLKRVGVPAHAETLASFNLAMVRAHRVSAGAHARPPTSPGPRWSASRTRWPSARPASVPPSWSSSSPG